MAVVVSHWMLSYMVSKSQLLIFFSVSTSFNFVLLVQTCTDIFNLSKQYKPENSCHRRENKPSCIFEIMKPGLYDNPKT